MRKIIRRLLDLRLPPGQSAFLWGPRQVGKSYWVREHLPEAIVIDLLHTDVFAEYAARPALLRERLVAAPGGLVVIDEVQKIPALLDEVHWLIEHTRRSFLLTGSSARKLRRGHANLLAGRAWRRTMVPLSIQEVDELDIEQVMVSGLLPPHFLEADPTEHLRAYVADYLKEEIAAEAIARDIPAFAEFLRVAALTSSELLNYTNVGRETGVSAKVVRGYFDVLEDTYLGFRLRPWLRVRRRRLIETEKFYLFDVGVANHLARRQPRLGSAEFGKSFEHYIFVVGDMALAIEVKAGTRVHDGDLRGLRALADEHVVRRCVVVCLEAQARVVAGGIEVLPWRLFLERLWAGDLGV
jgi:predicted AAA+ superfamily ATPase